MLVEPDALLTGSGTPYRVYTPFWRACGARAPFGRPEAAPAALPRPVDWPYSEPLEAFVPLPARPDWSGGLSDNWDPGETGALKRLTGFVRNGLGFYKTRRDRPDIDGTASLSPHLHWGEIGPRQVWHAVSERLRAGELSGREGQAEVFLKELVWREFSHHLLFHFPTLPDAPLDGRFDNFPWIDGHGEQLRAWQLGQTGYPIVDAGMRQLWQTGWMHNRVRMVVASFLTKHLLIPWQTGADWFWDTLVDADLASNSASWQWVAGCGADAAPYFRIFNPVLQGQKFDPLWRLCRPLGPRARPAPRKRHPLSLGGEAGGAGARWGAAGRHLPGPDRRPPDRAPPRPWRPMSTSRARTPRCRSKRARRLAL